MAKWADFIITAVKYNGDRTHISEVKRSRDTGESLNDEQIRTRGQIVNGIEKKGFTYVTAFKKSNGDYTKGARVEIVTVNEKKYLRTDKNKTARDNLENLPEF